MEISEGAYTLFGVALGSVLTQLSTWLGIRQADRRTGKEALYYLLELHRLLTTVDRLHRQLPVVITTIRQYTAYTSPTSEAEVDQMLSTWLHGLAAPLIGRQLTALKGGYEASLLKLAALDPVGAYRLRGMDELLQRVPEMLEAVQATSATHLGQQLPVSADIAAFFRQHFEGPDIAKALSQLRSVMQRLAGQLGRYTRRELAAELLREQAKEQEFPSQYAAYMAKAHEAFSPPA